MKNEMMNVDFDETELEGYTEKYSEEGLWAKIKENVAAIGVSLIYKALQLYYVSQSPTCPLKVKAGIYAALGYLISPIDVIADFIPVAGYTDDAAAIGFALLLAQMYITEDIKNQAKGKIKDLFGAKAVEALSEE